jgi:hypothetical protein
MTVGVELDYLNGERFGKYKALALSSIIPSHAVQKLQMPLHLA